ncbi:transglutaminase domain-containing protein [Seonamhaeicola aphaedonensis]|uniref:Transglutaminase superfamily protein n=1 Tax=Seonamhaeicola aphaedonensis TaxID=1461338 RepID=A0A3D9HL99_9FLAO|nr:transglutaminase domain-containing protein [Seonamhaeicola aphaedonensis]RED50269.1 transglutaminase superfamily protein [Seonamhaeicola aphaedonensis]
MRGLSFICLFLFALICEGQNYKFGKVSKEELEEKVCSIDSSASAAYLFKKRHTYFSYHRSDGFKLHTEMHARIKIYNQDGFDYATKEMNLYKDGVLEDKMTEFKAYTFNVENGKVIQNKLEKNEVYKSDVSKYLNEVKFTMPNIKSGSVVEYKYIIVSPFWSNVDEFIFQHSIPTKRVEAIFEVPEYFSFKPRTKGYLVFQPIQEEKRDKLFYKTEVPITENTKLDTKSLYRTGEIEYKKDIYTYDLENIAAINDEPYVNNINNYRASVKYELSYTKFPHSAIEYFSTTWQDVVERIYKSASFGDELKKTAYFKNDIDALLASVSDPVKKAALIFNFVKSQVKWNGYYGFYSEDIKKAYKDHVGNSGDINLMLTAMLRYAGLNANPVLVSTRNHGVPLFPTREGYNYVVTWVKLPDGSEALLDATEEYSIPNILPLRVLNWQGRIAAENGGSGLIDLYPRTKSKNLISMMLKIDEEGTIHGNYRSTKTNHKALAFRNEYIRADKSDFLERLENTYDGIKIENYVVKNDTDLSKPVTESYKFLKENQADIIGDKMYFSPLFHFRTVENPFKLEKREFPVDFGYPSVSSYKILINIPEGYIIESIPESVSLALPDSLGSFSYNVMGNGSTIQVAVETQINQSILSPIYYEALKEYFNTFIQKEAEQIVLSKV